MTGKIKIVEKSIYLKKDNVKIYVLIDTFCYK